MGVLYLKMSPMCLFSNVLLLFPVVPFILFSNNWLVISVLPNYYNQLLVQIFNKLNIIFRKVFYTLCTYMLKTSPGLLKRACFPGMTPGFLQFVVCWEEGWRWKGWNSSLLPRWVRVSFPASLFGFPKGFTILLVFIPVVLFIPCLFLTMQEQSVFEKNKINTNNSGKLIMS